VSGFARLAEIVYQQPNRQQATAFRMGAKPGDLRRPGEVLSGTRTLKSRDNLLRKHVKPAAKKLGLAGVTWHLLLHSYATMLDGVGTPVGTMKSLL
jgi:hypothetical protein